MAAKHLSFDDGTDPDFGLNMTNCLQQHEWPVSIGSDGSYKTGTIPKAQRSVYDADEASCMSQFGYDKDPPQLTDSQLREMYPHRLWEWKCLSDKGYSPEAAPSQQSFIDGYHDGDGTWTAYSQFTGTLSEEELTEMFRVCPRAT